MKEYSQVSHLSLKHFRKKCRQIKNKAKKTQHKVNLYGIQVKYIHEFLHNFPINQNTLQVKVRYLNNKPALLKPIHKKHLIFKQRISRKSLCGLQCLLKLFQFDLKHYLITIQQASCHKSGVISSSSSSYCISAKKKKIILTCNKYYQLTSHSYHVRQQKHIYLY